mmetsp:Transcript_19756/g.35118  ORF Transcript_19756/g.35118 Transcript_19756/m.35118 type:complete len:496 (-) Transcript_19756:67-1554(-)
MRQSHPNGSSELAQVVVPQTAQRSVQLLQRVEQNGGGVGSLRVEQNGKPQILLAAPMQAGGSFTPSPAIAATSSQKVQPDMQKPSHSADSESATLLAKDVSREDESDDSSREDGEGQEKPPLWLKLVKWALPAFLFMFSTFICMWQLHIATYYYITEMDRNEAAYILNPDYKDKGVLSSGLKPTDISYGSLEDPLEASLGWKAVNITVLDAVAAFFPFAWGIFVLWKQDLQCWTKILLCNSLLALGKGTFGSVTVVPDSIGWSQCKARLGPDALHFFRHEVPSPAEHGVMSTFMTLLSAETFGPDHNRLGSGMRYCGDMIYSGHTYFTCLYILGFLELLRSFLKKRLQHPETKRKAEYILWTVYAICITEQCIEIALVLQNRFHYTLDVVMAVIMTLLTFTSSPICIAAKRWANYGGGGEIAHSAVYQDPQVQELSKQANEKGFMMVPSSDMTSDGDIWLPVFCFPFCCLHGTHHLISDEHYKRMGMETHDEMLA